MLWVLLFVAIAVAGLAMVVGYAVWLAHKTADVLAEVRVLGRRAGELGELASQVGAPSRPGGRDPDRDVSGLGDGAIH